MNKQTHIKLLQDVNIPLPVIELLCKHTGDNVLNLGWITPANTPSVIPEDLKDWFVTIQYSEVLGGGITPIHYTETELGLCTALLNDLIKKGIPPDTACSFCIVNTNKILENCREFKWSDLRHHIENRCDFHKYILARLQGQWEKLSKGTYRIGPLLEESERCTSMVYMDIIKASYDACNLEKKDPRYIGNPYNDVLTASTGQITLYSLTSSNLYTDIDTDYGFCIASVDFIEKSGISKSDLPEDSGVNITFEEDVIVFFNIFGLWFIGSKTEEIIEFFPNETIGLTCLDRLRKQHTADRRLTTERKFYHLPKVMKL